MLNLQIHGSPTEHPPLLIVHGLYGSARNWGVIAKHLSADREVIAVDQRNHGDSYWTESHTYEDMAADLAHVIDEHGGRADVLGHSMGGKAAMQLALTRPEMEGLLREVLDIDFGSHCPHGRPVIKRLGRSEIERMFHRS